MKGARKLKQSTVVKQISKDKKVEDDEIDEAELSDDGHGQKEDE